jgi:SpoVK/Ycf46/Vps4 family AAA+-type ATPase
VSSSAERAWDGVWEQNRGKPIHCSGADYWTTATNKRYPWFPRAVADEIKQWCLEASRAEELRLAGEKVMPLLLAGDTRCGKTSVVCETARHLGVPVFRMSVAKLITSWLGETAKALQAALNYAKTSQAGNAIWIVDEIDGVFQQRGTANSSAAREMNVAVSAGLTMIEDLPAKVMLVATSNEPDLIDRAMAARFNIVHFPRWEELAEEERRAFAKSHGYEDAFRSGSYALCVQAARRERVRKILEAGGTET